jgi:4-hydroxybenzoate polyprenyltransferase
LKWFINACKLVFARKIAKDLLDFIGYSNLFLALAVFCSTIQGGFIFKETFDPSVSFAFLNFTAAFCLYCLQRIFQSSLPTTDVRLLWYRRNKKWLFTIGILLAIGFSETAWNIFITYKQGIFVYCICALLSIFYFLPPFNLRNIAGIKQFYIALIWILVCIVIPFMFEEEHFTGTMHFKKDQILYIISQFFFIAALCIPFDIRDVNKDRLEGTKSLPVIIGIKQSKFIGMVLMVFYFVFAFFIETQNLLLIRGIVLLVTIAAIYFSEPKRHRYYCIYFVEGIIILQTILLAYLL